MSNKEKSGNALSGIPLKPVPEHGNIEKDMKFSRKKIYWLSQVSGWSFFGLVNIIVIYSFERLTWQRALVWVYLCYSGIFFTHLFRSYIKKNNWLNLPLKKTIPRVLIASLVLGFIMYILVFAVNYAAGLFESDRFKVITPFVATINLSSIVLLWALIYFAVHYFENYKRVQIESLIWEAAVKDFELKTLKSQLNPHFMFNAMNSIRALIEEDPANAQNAVTKLSNILRYSLKIERTETVPLEDEMQTVSDYLALESIRFEERLKYKVTIDPKSSKIEIPPMMIQTLVENGIKHGISKKTQGGEISVDSKMTGTDLHIQIRNTGHFDDELFHNSKGFGISNTKHRLSLLFGDDASFTIKNENQNVVLAELVIPTGGSNQ
ncbi:MAG: histidine kinase [Ignavibacteriales bacterium]|nr:MAG: histidine kinase [Ignavibacteriales bacterium]